MQIKFFQKKHSIFTRGTTILEVVIYSTLLALITITTVTALLKINESLQGVILGRIVDDAAQEVMEKIIREIRFADNINTTTSVLGVNPSVLVLNSTDTGGTPVEVGFSISGGTLELWRDSVLVGPLTPEQVVINELVFDRITTPESEAVKVSLVLEASRGPVNVEETFNTTVILRSSY